MSPQFSRVRAAAEPGGGGDRSTLEMAPLRNALTGTKSRMTQTWFVMPSSPRSDMATVSQATSAKAATTLDANASRSS